MLTGSMSPGRRHPAMRILGYIKPAFSMSTATEKTKQPVPPFKEQEQIAPPGPEEQMNPRADHGEESYKGHGFLEGRSAIITGADSGIGRAVAIAFAREGANVCISYLDEESDARETERLVRDAGRKALRIGGDIRDEEHCKSIIDRAKAGFGEIDILVNNAAFQSTHSDPTDFSTEEFERTFKTNVFATFFLCKAVLPHMKPGSNIINTVSIQSFDPDGQLLAYASTKSALAGFTRSLARTAIERGVRVNAVAPGPVWTPLIPSTMPAEKVKKFGESTVFKRPAQPAELAPIYVFLASAQASYVTGEIYGATGGQTPL